MGIRNSMLVVATFAWVSSISLAEIQQHAKSGAAVPASTERTAAESRLTWLPAPAGATTGYVMVKGKSAANLMTESGSPHISGRIAKGTSSSMETIGFDTNGSPQVKDVDASGKAVYRQLNFQNEIEKKTAEELADFLRSNPALSEKSPYKEFLARLSSGFPPSAKTKPTEVLAAGEADAAAFSAYNAKIQAYQTKLQSEHPKRVADLVGALKEALAETDPKKKQGALEKTLFDVFAQGLEAPGVETGTENWDAFLGGSTLNDDQMRRAAAHYSHTQIEARKKVIAAVADEIRKTDGRLANLITRVGDTAASTAYDLLLADSHDAKDPQCATCGGMTHQSEFDDLINNGVQKSLLALNAPATALPSSAGSAAMTRFAPEKPVFRIGTCFYCKSASAEYKARAEAVIAEIRQSYPGAVIEEYDAKAAGEIQYGEVTVHEGGQRVLSPRRIYGKVVDELKGLLPIRAKN